MRFNHKVVAITGAAQGLADRPQSKRRVRVRGCY